MRTKIRYALMLLIIVLLTGNAHAQSSQARIAGTIYDANHAVIPGATVTASNEATAEIRTVVSDGQGAYSISNLKPSLYTITISAKGFAFTKASGTRLVVGQTLTADFSLEPEQTGAVVDVTAGDMNGLNTSSASMGASVSPREVQSLPYNNRQLSQLALQAPGTQNTGSGTWSDFRSSGRAVEQNKITYDGVEGSAIIDSSPGNLNGEIASPFRLQASLENVQEFRVNSNSYPAEYGTGTGAQVDVVTKSGGDSFHGSIFEYFRNDALDARNFFDQAKKTPLRMNQFGFSLGGPILKNRLFFFGSYEGYRLRSGVNIVEGVPKLSRCASAVNATIRTLCTEAFLAQGATRIVTASNQDFDIGQLVASNPVNENSMSLRLDFIANKNNTGYFRFFRDHGTNDQPQNVSGSRAVYDYVPQNAVFAWQTVFGSNKINDFKIGYNSAYTRVSGSAPTIGGNDLSAVTLNLSGSVALQNIPGQGNSAGLSIPGGLFRLNSATNGRGAPYTPYSISLMDAFSWTRGNHSIKFGGEIRFLRLYTDRLGGTTYSFSNLANFLNNTASSISYNGDVSSPSAFNNGATGKRYAKEEFYIGYVQDEWKVRPNLTLNLGLRYEYYTPLREDKNRQVVFDINRGVILPADSVPYHSSKLNFAPRLSMAWSITPKTILRTGFGINYGPGQIEDQIQPIESDRIASTISNVSNAFPANIPAIIANFTANPNNRNYQPRAYDRDNYTVPEKIFTYSVSLQRQLPYQMVLTAAYVGSQGRNLFLRSVANQIKEVRTNVNPANAAIIIRDFSIVTENGQGQNPTVQNPYAEIDYKRSGGRDSYNALQIALSRQFDTGLTLNAQYTFGKSFGNTAGSNEATTVGNIARRLEDFDYDIGYNNFDVRHNFNITALYTLPFGKHLTGIGGALLKNWDVGIIVNARSGIPIPVQITRPDILYRDDATGIFYGGPATGRTAIINTPGGGNSRNVRRPDLIPGVPIFLNGFLNPAAFAIPKPGTFGNLMRNSIHGPGFLQTDLVFSKKVRLSEKFNMEFRAEIFNAFNKANFANPPAQLPNTFGTGTVTTLQPGQPFTQVLSGSAFGKYARTVSRDVGLGTNRQIQGVVRFYF